MSSIEGLADLNALGLGATTTSKQTENEVGQQQFLELMVAQLQHQDPFKPMENGEFLSQIAQFSQVSGIQDMQSSIDELVGSMTGNQALQAAGLVGRTVLAPGGQGYFSGMQPLTGVVDLPQSVADLRIKIHDQAGQLVRTVNLGTQTAGNAGFVWDGLADDGSAMPPGVYRVEAEALAGGETMGFETLVDVPVTGVVLAPGGRGISVELAGLGTRSLADIREIH